MGPSRSTPSRNHRDPKQGSLNTLSSLVQHEKRSDATRILDSPLIEPYRNDYPEWDLDDAIMHYEPDESLPEALVSESRMISPSVISHPVPIPIPDRRRGQTPPLVTPTDPIPSYSPKGSSSKKTKKKTTKATRIHTDIPDDELFKRLKTDILSDKHLYLRILRYEVCLVSTIVTPQSERMHEQPIHFDVFLQLAAQSGVSSKGLKYRVRSFLDQQVRVCRIGIHWCSSYVCHLRPFSSRIWTRRAMVASRNVAVNSFDIPLNSIRHTCTLYVAT